MNDYADQKRKYRARKRENGYVLKQIWVKPSAWKDIKEYIKRANK